MSLCGKNRYPSRAYAKRVARRDLGPLTKGRKLETYWCNRCDAWHLTSHGKKTAKRKDTQP